MGLLSDKVAVITGASSGVGRAIALGLADQGVSLCLVGRKLEKLEEVAKIAESITPCVKGYRVDMTLDNNIEEFAVRLKQDFGHIDILIHSAGVISRDDWRRRLLKILTGSIELTFVPHMF